MFYDTMEYSQIIYMNDISLLAYDEVNDLYYVIYIDKEENKSTFNIYETFKEAKKKYNEKIIKLNEF